MRGAYGGMGGGRGGYRRRGLPLPTFAMPEGSRCLRCNAQVGGQDGNCLECGRVLMAPVTLQDIEAKLEREQAAEAAGREIERIIKGMAKERGVKDEGY